MPSRSLDIWHHSFRREVELPQTWVSACVLSAPWENAGYTDFNIRMVSPPISFHSDARFAPKADIRIGERYG